MATKRTKKTTNKELAKRYNVSDKTISRYKKNGQLADFILKQDTIIMKQEVAVQVQTIMTDEMITRAIERGALEQLDKLINQYSNSPEEIAKIEPERKALIQLKALEVVSKFNG